MTPSDPATTADPATDGRPARTRDAAATRRSLLVAARELFAAVGYDATTVRAIADRAGVNQALLFRHFGNKEGLFAEAVSGQAAAVLHDGPPEQLLARTLEAMLSTDPSGAELLYSVLRSTGNSDASAAVRDQLAASWGGAFAAQAKTDDPADAALRAELLLAWLLGIGLLRMVITTPAVGDADPQAITDHVLRTAATLLDGAPPS